MALVIPFSTPHDAARAVREETQAAGVDLHLLPYQPMNPEAPWWLSPGRENPGYRHGKAIFTRDLLRPQDLFVGLYMEKGIGRAGAPMYSDSKKGRRYIMDGPGRIGDQWTWPAFAAALACGEIDTVSRRAEVGAGQPLLIMVDGCHVPVPAGAGDVIDIHGLRFPRDVISFRCSQGILSLSETSYRADLLRPLASATTFEALAQALQRLPELDMFWVDVSIGLRFRALTRVATAEDNPWNARSLWERVLSPYRAWLR
jgi:hypothetical protein